MVCFDTETRTETDADGVDRHYLLFGWAAYRRRHRSGRWSKPQWLRFTTKEQFWDWMESLAPSGTKVSAYCHNAAFDLAVLDSFNVMEERRWVVHKACLEGPPTIIAWRRNRATLNFLDTLNYWRVPLWKLGERVGLPKIDFKDWGTMSEEADTYCRRDVDILWRSLSSWWEWLAEQDLGTASPTLASQSFTAYRHRFMPCEIYIDNNPEALELARGSYMGGRTECFRLGHVRGPVYALDVNSMYPFVMRDLECPVRLVTRMGRVPLPKLERLARDYAVCARVRVQTDAPDYPAYVDGRLCFPVGRFDTVLPTPELRRALERGHVVSCSAAAVYEKAVIFRDFVEWAWSERLKARARGDVVADFYLKILANSLYGKFGQRGIYWEETETFLPGVTADLSSFDLDRREWRRIRAVGGRVQILNQEAESFNSHPAIAAHVTSASRLFLGERIDDAGRINIHYLDTDSLMVNEQGRAALADYIDADSLGGLKVEHTWEWMQINGLKDYITPDYVKLKGVRADAFMLGESMRLTQQWSSWKGLLQSGDMSAPVVRPWVKTLRREYTKGEVTDGGLVVPLRLGSRRR